MFVFIWFSAHFDTIYFRCNDRNNRVLKYHFLHSGNKLRIFHEYTKSVLWARVADKVLVNEREITLILGKKTSILSRKIAYCELLSMLRVANRNVNFQFVTKWKYFLFLSWICKIRLKSHSPQRQPESIEAPHSAAWQVYNTRILSEVFCAADIC